MRSLKKIILNPLLIIGPLIILKEPVNKQLNIINKKLQNKKI
jgi:hypothetical protein